MSVRTRALIILTAAVVLSQASGIEPASAAPDERANCVGEFASAMNQFGQTFGVQGLGGRLVSDAARREGGVARYARVDDCDD